MKLQRNVMLLTALLMSLLFFVVGCGLAKKPNMQTPTNPMTNQNTNNDKRVADKVTAEAENVNHVKGATAIVSGKEIYLGLDLDANLEMNKRAEVENTVLNMVKKSEPSYTITIASDVDTVTRIKKVAQGIEQGKPLSGFEKELKEIKNRLKPKTE